MKKVVNIWKIFLKFISILSNQTKLFPGIELWYDDVHARCSVSKWWKSNILYINSGNRTERPERYLAWQHVCSVTYNAPSICHDFNKWIMFYLFHVTAAYCHYVSFTRPCKRSPEIPLKIFHKDLVQHSRKFQYIALHWLGNVYSFFYFLTFD